MPARQEEKKLDGKECATCQSQASPAAAVQAKNTTVDIDGEVADIDSQLPEKPNPPKRRHPQFVHCMPPDEPEYRTKQKWSVFLAGSIEMGAAVQWQKLMAEYLSDLPITVHNPRRGHWDPNATQEAKNVEFRKQVEWELGCLERSTVICFFFDCNTKSPVTMMELGLWAGKPEADRKVVVCCDKRFWRAGNIHIVCDRYNIPMVENFADLVPAIKKELERKGMQLHEERDENGNVVGYGPQEA